MRQITKLLLAALVVFSSMLPVRESLAEPVDPAMAGQNDVVDVSQFGSAVSGNDLMAQNGRLDMQIDQLNFQASTSDQSNSYVGGNYLLNPGATGINSVSDSAFTNASGIATVIQNSGNQVLIQNSMILNLLLR
ncbi:hypothetical protein [Geobacter sp.]|uniref:hypothetical protein n=1 Tax=Geobacter sp. TaxID=46610 RepID=UPI0026345789|nr:hypothetical protein [Geobacter sp.]